MLPVKKKTRTAEWPQNRCGPHQHTPPVPVPFWYSYYLGKSHLAPALLSVRLWKPLQVGWMWMRHMGKRSLRHYNTHAGNSEHIYHFSSCFVQFGIIRAWASVHKEGCIVTARTTQCLIYFLTRNKSHICILSLCVCVYEQVFSLIGSTCSLGAIPAFIKWPPRVNIYMKFEVRQEVTQGGQRENGLDEQLLWVDVIVSVR